MPRRCRQGLRQILRGQRAASEEIWDELIRIRNQMGKTLGYENYIPLGYLEQSRTDYGEKEVASFREQVRMFLCPAVPEAL